MGDWRTDTSDATPHRDAIRAARREVVGARGGWLAGGTSPGRLLTSGTGEPPLRIPGYEQIEELYRGGQGVVYRALQTGTDRVVAIKVMRDYLLAGQAECARFEREVHILARLRHPNIVAIHETGEVCGRRYFVMEFVAGRSLDTHVLAERLDVQGAVRLFLKVCRAVETAHLHGVLHRDLKPRNIRIDGHGEPRVLDFGLAKPLGDRARDADMTQTGQCVGSLPWASPEQLSGREVDLRTDVYSLGVILFELLTGGLPFPHSPRAASLRDHDLVREPVRPRSVRRDVPAELEAIVLKCLEHEPDRRYQSAGELARDLARYLAGEPVEARCDSAWYVLCKSLRRNAPAVAIGLGFVAVLTVFLVTALIQSAQTAQQRDRAVTQANRAERVQGFLQGMLATADPSRTPNANRTVRQMLDEGVLRAEAELAELPDVLAAVYDTIGQTYATLGLYEQAEETLRRALELRRATFGGHHLDVAESLSHMASLLQDLRQADAAEPYARQALAVRRELLGPRHALVAASLTRLGYILFDQGEFETARDLAEQAADLHAQLSEEPDAAYAAALGLFAHCLTEIGDLEQAEAAASDAVAITRAALGPDHPAVAARLTELFEALEDQRKLPEAEACAREAVRIRRQALGDAHPALAWNLRCLAKVLLAQGRPAAAEPLCREALAIQQAAREPGHRDIADCRELLAQIRTALDGG